MSLLDPDKISAIIITVLEALESRSSYRVICDITSSEMVELEKHFNITLDSSIRDKQIYIFKNK